MKEIIEEVVTDINEDQKNFIKEKVKTVIKNRDKARKELDRLEKVLSELSGLDTQEALDYFESKDSLTSASGVQYITFTGGGSGVTMSSR